MNSLDAALISQRLRSRTSKRLDKLEVFDSIDSTNSYLMAQPAPRQGRFHVAIANHQVRGRGQRDRRWASPPGAGLYLSVGYSFEDLPAHLPGLTLALGVAVVNALAANGVVGVGLKWPNDIVALDGKLGGILTELQSGAGNRAVVVAGIGLNLDLPGGLEIDTQAGRVLDAVDVNTLAAGLPPRPDLAASVIDELCAAIVTYVCEGFDAFADDWRQHDWLQGRRVIVEVAGRQVAGVAAGVDTDGALLVRDGASHTRIVSGSVVQVGQVERAS